MNDNVLICWDATYSGLRTLSRVLSNLIYLQKTKITKVLYLYCEYMYESELKDYRTNGITSKERIDFLQNIDTTQADAYKASLLKKMYLNQLTEEESLKLNKLKEEPDFYKRTLPIFCPTLQFLPIKIPQTHIPPECGDSFVEIEKAMKDILLPELVNLNPKEVHISLASGTQAMKSTFITMFSQSIFNAYVGNNVKVWAFSDEAIKSKGNRFTENERLVEQKISQNPYIASIESEKYSNGDYYSFDLDQDGIIKKTATIDAPFLLLGERGTGKSFIIESVYKSKIQTKILKNNAPFKTVLCGSLAGTLVDDILFGHWKDAYTGASTDQAGAFETCNGGLLFLDEIQDLPKDTQRKILRAINEGKISRLGHPAKKDQQDEIDVKVSIVCASNRTLEELQAKDKLDPDFLDRIARFICEMKPLREYSTEQLRTIWKIRWAASVYKDRLRLPETPDDFDLVKDTLVESKMYGNIRDINQLIAYIARDVYEGVPNPSLNKKKEKYQKVLNQWKKDYQKKYPSSVFPDTDKTKLMLEEYGWEGMNRLFKQWLAGYAKDVYGSDITVAQKMRVTERTLREVRKKNSAKNYTSLSETTRTTKN